MCKNRADAVLAGVECRVSKTKSVSKSFMLPRVTLYFDVISPYAWLGFEGLTRLAPEWGAEIRLKPFFLGGVMRATGNQVTP